MQQAQRRPCEHGSSNTIAGIAEWYGRNVDKITKGVKNGLKKENPQSSKGLAFERSKPINNEKSEDSSHHKRLRMSGKMHR